jgi:hypothetical protein
MGYLLVALNLFMQSVLLWLIFQEVVVSNVEWQDGILKLGGSGDHIMGLVAESPGGCNDGKALCFIDRQGRYSCAPPSVQLVGRWDELDTNKDGMWHKEEVIAQRSELQCKYVIDPIVLFEVLIMMLKERENTIWLHPLIKNGTAIMLPYFTYIMSDVIMCGYRSADMCSNLFERGYFDAPLKYGTSPRVGDSIDSALRYCRNLLQPGGMCERTLPSTYAVWKITSEGECGQADYDGFKYTNPGNGITKTLLKVDYSARLEYELAQKFMFNLFKGIMIFLWLLAMTSDFKDIVKIMTLCLRYPSADEFGEDSVIVEQDPSDPEDIRYRIQGITSRHRYTTMVLCFCRFLITCVLMIVGVSYLIKTNGYADLIMNGVSLAFIAEVSSVLYSEVLREEVKDQTEDIKPLKVEMYGIDYLNRRPALIDMLCVVIIMFATYAIIQWQLINFVVPVHTALECTCLSQGDTCFEAQKYNFDFWQEYWLHKIPDVFKQVDSLKAEALSAAGASLLMTSTKEAHVKLSSMEEQLAETVDDVEQEMHGLQEIRIAKLTQAPKILVKTSVLEIGDQQKLKHSKTIQQVPIRPHGHRNLMARDKE